MQSRCRTVMGRGPPTQNHEEVNSEVPAATRGQFFFIIIISDQYGQKEQVREREIPFSYLASSLVLAPPINQT